MTDWYFRVIQTGINCIPDFIDYYLLEFEQAKKDVNMNGRIETASQMLAGQSLKRWVQLQEIEAVLEHLNIQYKRLKTDRVKHYRTAVDQSLNRLEAEKWAEGDPEVIEMAILVNTVALVRNKYLGLHQALQVKGFQINNITKLRAGGLEEVELG